MDSSKINNNTDTKNRFYGFFQTIFTYYWQTIIFFMLLVIILLLLKYAHNNLNFPESKMIINWFAIIVIGNLLITYSIIMIYQQVKNQPGYEGPSGLQGPLGSQGGSDVCSYCNKKEEGMEPVNELVAPPQPVLPGEVIATPSVRETYFKNRRQIPSNAA